MFSYVLGAIGLVICARVMYQWTGKWHRPGRPPMSVSKRWMALLTVAGGMYLLVTCIMDFTARRMDIYWAAREQITNSKVFTDCIGHPFSAEWPIRLNAEATDTDGKAAFEAKVKGPRGKGVLIAAGKKESEEWHLTRLQLESLSRGCSMTFIPPTAAQASMH